MVRCLGVVGVAAFLSSLVAGCSGGSGSGGGGFVASTPGPLPSPAPNPGAAGAGLPTLPSGPGTNGGTVAGPGGAMIVIPAGALNATVPITVTTAQPFAVNGRIAGPVIEIGPSGVPFALPALVTVPFDPALLAAGRTGVNLAVYVRSADGTLERLVPIAVGPTTLTVRVTHLSLFVAVDDGLPLATRLLAVSGDGQSATAAAALQGPLAVVLVDSGGKPIAGAGVSFSATVGGGTPAKKVALTDAEGRAQTAFTLGPRAGQQTIQATVNLGTNQPPPLGSPVTFKATATAGVPAQLRKTSGDLQGGTPGRALAAPLVVTVKDAKGNPVADVAVAFAVTAGGGVVTPSATTDGAGRASATLTLGATGINSVQASAAGLPAVAFKALGSSATRDGEQNASTVVAAPSVNVPADGQATTTVTVTVLDGGGAPVPDQVVQLFASGSQNEITLLNLTDANGQVTGTVASKVAEQKTISASVGDPGAPLNATAVVTFAGVVATLSSNRSTVSLAPAANVSADGVSTATVTVTVRDANDNPLQGQTVQLAASGSNNNIMQPAATTDAQGQATGSIATTMAEQKTITITVNPGAGQVVLDQQPAITFEVVRVVDANRSQVLTNPTGNVKADGVAIAALEVVVTNGQGNPLAGQSVVFASTGSNNNLVQPAAPTDANGRARATIASTTAEVKQISATVNPGGIVLNAKPNVTFVAAPATPKTLVIWYGIGSQDGVETDMLRNLDEMETGLGAGAPNLTVVAVMSSVKTPIAGTTYKNSTQTNAKVITIQPDPTVGQVNSPSKDLPASFDATDPAQMATAIGDILKANPADRKILIVSDHGCSWTGWGSAKTPVDRKVNLPMWKQALQTVTGDAANQTPQFEIICTDCCTMACLEVDFMLSAFARFRVSCEPPMTGYRYNRWMPRLIQEPGMSSSDLAVWISKSYFDYKAGTTSAGRDDVISVVDLSKIPALADAVEAMAQALKAVPSDAASIGSEVRAFATAPRFKIFSNTPLELPDLGVAAKNLAANAVFDANTRAKAGAVAAAVAAAVLDVRAGANYTGSTGLAIWYPPSERMWAMDNYAAEVDFAQQKTSWRDYLKAGNSAKAAVFSAPAEQSTARSIAEANNVGPSRAAPATVTVDVTNSSRATFASDVFLDLLGDGAFFLELGTVDGGTTLPGAQSDHKWDGSLLVISDGTVSQYAAGQIIDPNAPNLVGVNASYTTADGSATRDVLIAVDVKTGQIVAIYEASGAGTDDVSGLQSLTLEPGGTLQLYFNCYVAEIDELVSFLDPGVTLTVGPNGLLDLSVDFAPAPSGNYYFEVDVEDPAGNLSQAGMIVTVP